MPGSLQERPFPHETCYYIKLSLMVDAVHSLLYFTFCVISLFLSSRKMSSEQSKEYVSIKKPIMSP